MLEDLIKQLICSIDKLTTTLENSAVIVPSANTKAAAKDPDFPGNGRWQEGRCCHRRIHQEQVKSYIKTSASSDAEVSFLQPVAADNSCL